MIRYYSPNNPRPLTDDPYPGSFKDPRAIRLYNRIAGLYADMSLTNNDRDRLRSIYGALRLSVGVMYGWIRVYSKRPLRDIHADLVDFEQRHALKHFEGTRQ